jgi:hypothetical protein
MTVDQHNCLEKLAARQPRVAPGIKIARPRTCATSRLTVCCTDVTLAIPLYFGRNVIEVLTKFRAHYLAPGGVHFVTAGDKEQVKGLANVRQSGLMVKPVASLP